MKTKEFNILGLCTDIQRMPHCPRVAHFKAEISNELDTALLTAPGGRVRLRVTVECPPLSVEERLAELEAEVARLKAGAS